MCFPANKRKSCKNQILASIYLCFIIQTSNHCEGSSKKDTSKDTSKSHDKKVFLDFYITKIRKTNLNV